VRDINIFHHFRLSATALVLTEIIGMMILNTGEFKRASAIMGHWLQDYMMMKPCIEYCRNSYYLCIWFAKTYSFTRAVILFFVHA